MRAVRAATLALFIALAGVRSAPPVPADEDRQQKNVEDYQVNKATGIGYRLVYKAESWPVARDHCQDEGAKLAVPKTIEDYLYIQKLVRGMHYPAVSGADFKLVVWLGIHNLDDYRVWKNVDGENIDKTGFHKWSHGNGEGFSDAPEEPHCAGLGAVGWLRDFWCHRRLPYVCQSDANI